MPGALWRPAFLQEIGASLPPDVSVWDVAGSTF
jgi:hypothetical protein